MRGFTNRVWLVSLFGVLLFALRDVWGMHTEGLTSLFAGGFEDKFVIARITSLVGAIIWSFIYMAFQFFVLAFIIHKLTNVELSKVAVLQLFVVALLLMEKAFIFFLYAVVGYTTDFSILSFGPLAATFLENEFFTYFLNELTIITALVVAIQFRFLRAFTTMSARNLLFILIVIQLVLALLIAGIQVLPIESWFEGGKTV